MTKYGSGRRTMQFGAYGLALAAAVSVPRVWAQAPAGKDADMSVQTFYLANVSQTNEVQDIVTAMRNLLDARDKIYVVQSQNAIVVQATPEQLKLTRRLLDDLDRPKKTYRLTFATDELDGDKVVGTQHFAMIVVSGGRTTTKIGTKVPIVTGSYQPQPGTGSQKQVTYLDIGLNVDASLDESSQGLRLRSKVERLSVAPEEHASMGSDDPLIRQAQIEGTANLVPGKPLQLGSLDVPGSTRHVNVSVVAEVVR